jgi:predicted N-acetyltransferase YhbS
MNLTLREGTPDDARACGTVNYEAFKSIADQHNYPPDYPDPDSAIAFCRFLLGNPGFYKVVAEIDGRIVGSNFMDERGAIAGIGPISVAPNVQNSGLGRRLMQNALERARSRSFAGVRLVQAAYHRRSLSLYTKLGFDARQTLSAFQGPALNLSVPGCAVRPARESDVEACNQLCLRIHGHDRGGELRDAITMGPAMVVERAGRVTGYTTGVGWIGHTLGESSDDLQALIGAAQLFVSPGFLVPSYNGELMRWCLGHGFKIVEQMTLMTIGLYNEPRGAWLPSVLY